MKLNPYLDLAFDGQCRFGMLIDRFGTPWIVNADQQVGS